jgi:glycerol-3-phosphate O-acyltransferase
MRSEDQERALVEVQSRVVSACVMAASTGGSPLEEVVANSIYFEKRRLKEEPSGSKRDDDATFWSGVHRSVNRASEREQQDILASIVKRYAEEIVGNFDERVYRFTTKILPTGLSVLLNAVSPKRLMKNFGAMPRIDETIIVQGETEQLRRLHEVGTVILVPTHVSNIDSIAVGYAIYQLGLPPFIYGAGLNLFSNPLISFFMHNLGAYTVDRKKRDPLYIEVLKAYATITLECGYDNIFFPGGTRCRSGAIERHLKLGLLGTSVGAYVNNLKRKLATPKIFIVPATISCQLVLEAETLVDDFLKEVGKARYIITDDEFSQPKRVYDFAQKLLSLDSKIYMTVSRAIDPFGNDVDDNGESLDPKGRRLDTSRFVMRDGAPEHLAQRDAEYTHEVGKRVVEAYSRDNVIHTTNVTARAVFNLLRRKNPQQDLLRLIRVGGKIEDLELRAVYEEASRLLDLLRPLAGDKKIRLGPIVDRGATEDVVASGLRHFAIYHNTPAAERKGDRVMASDRSVLFYYQNRLEGYSLEADLAPTLNVEHTALNLSGAKRITT